MAAVISLLIILAVSFFVVRVGTVALMMTGLSEEVASFQSLSAFSGVGFTTSEAESVVVSQARRSIIKTLIRLGSAGVVTVISSLILSFTGTEAQTGRRILVIAIGLMVLAMLSQSRAFQSLITPLIRTALRRVGFMDLQDYASILHVTEGYGIAEMQISPDSWLSGRTLRELRLNTEGVSVLGAMRRGSEYIGAPPPQYTFAAGDRIIAYGRHARLAELAARKQGNVEAHSSAQQDHQEALKKEGVAGKEPH